MQNNLMYLIQGRTHTYHLRQYYSVAEDVGVMHLDLGCHEP